MAITFGGSAMGTFGAAGTIAFTIDMTSSADSVLVVSSVNRGNTGTITSMTLNGTSMTRISTISGGAAGLVMTGEMRYFQAPGQIIGTIGGTYSSASTGGIMVASFYNGAAQSGVFDVAGSAVGTSGTAKTVITPSEGNCVIVDGMIHESSSISTMGTPNQVQLRRVDEGVWNTGASYFIQGATGSAGTMYWTNASSDVWVQTAASFKAGTGIAFDSGGSAGQGAAGSTTLSWTHTAAGTAICLVVTTHSNSGTQATGVTYGGTALTKVIGTQISTQADATIWYLKNTGAGAATITATWPNSINTGVGLSTTYTGVDSTTAVTGSSSGTVNATSGSILGTTTNANSWMVSSYTNSSIFAGTVDTSTGGIKRSNGTSASNSAILQTKGPIASGGGIGTARWAGIASGQNLSMVSLILTPTQAAATPSTYSTFKTLTGIGNI